MTIAFKSLIKKIGTEPMKVRSSDYENFSKQLLFYTHEFAHIVILICTAKSEATLCHLMSSLEQLLDKV